MLAQSCGLLDRARTCQGQVMLFPAAASSPQWQMTLSSLPSQTLQCYASQVTSFSSYAIQTTVTCDEPAVPPHPQNAFGICLWCVVLCLYVHFEHLSQILYRLPFSRIENVALALTNFTVNIFIRQFKIIFGLLFMVFNDISGSNSCTPVWFLLAVV